MPETPAPEPDRAQHVAARAAGLGYLVIIGAGVFAELVVRSGIVEGRPGGGVVGWLGRVGSGPPDNAASGGPIRLRAANT